MALTPLGEKVANVLVDGTQQDSFTQRESEADYNVNISTSASLANPITQGESINYRYTGSYSSSSGSGTTISTSGFSLPMRVYGKVSMTDGGDDASVTVHHGNGTKTWEARAGDTVNFDQSFTGVTKVEYSYLVYEYETVTVDYTVEVNPELNSNYSINGVTQTEL